MQSGKLFKIATGSLCALLSIGFFGCSGRSGDTDAGTDAGTDGGNGEDYITIYDIQDEGAANHPGSGSQVKVKEVVVTTPMTIGDSQDSTGPDSFWVSETAGGPYSGIFVIGVNVQGLGTLEPGALVNIEGEYLEGDSAILSWGNGVIIASSITPVGTGVIPDPEAVSVSDVITGSANAEKYEGVLVRLTDVTVSQLEPAYGNFYVKQTGSEDELIVSPRFDEHYSYDPALDDVISSLTGVMEYSYSDFRLQPRSCNDLLGDGGTPLCEQTECPVDPVTIVQIQNPDAPGHVPVGCQVTVENAVVTSAAFETSGSDAFFIQDSDGGPWSGVFVFARDTSAPTLEPGDLVTVVGEVSEYEGKTEIIANLVSAPEAGTAPEPTLVSPAEIRTGGALAEAYEGVLVKVENVVVTQAVVLGSDGGDHGEFAVSALDAPDDDLVIGWLMEHGYACPDASSCGEDLRKAGDSFNSITGLLDSYQDEFTLEPRHLDDLDLKEVDPNDLDGDGVVNADDNCPDDFNPNQEDLGDGDGVGDVCDNCPDDENADQADGDTDEVGDVCDNCPADANQNQADQDSDGVGNVCDPDQDGDGIDEGDGSNPCTGGVTQACDDNCPMVPNPDQIDDNGNSVGDACEGHLLLSEVCVKPGGSEPGDGEEFVEIYNPTGNVIQLDNYYLWDATSSSALYWEIATLSSVESHDFAVRFPAGSSIAAGEFLTISVAAASDFSTNVGVEPDFALRGDGSGNTMNMLPVFDGAVGSSAGLSNSGEVVVLFYWDGASELVQDVDYLLWGDGAEASDKTGILNYLPDTAVDQQDTLGSHDNDKSFQRCLNLGPLEGTEVQTGGNGISGNDETSENVSETWTSADRTPGEATVDCAK